MEFTASTPELRSFSNRGVSEAAIAAQVECATQLDGEWVPEESSPRFSASHAGAVGVPIDE